MTTLAKVASAAAFASAATFQMPPHVSHKSNSIARIYQCLQFRLLPDVPPLCRLRWAREVAGEAVVVGAGETAVAGAGEVAPLI
jgi:hypothetical protein